MLLRSLPCTANQTSRPDRLQPFMKPKNWYNSLGPIRDDLKMNEVLSTDCVMKMCHDHTEPCWAISSHFVCWKRVSISQKNSDDQTKVANIKHIKWQRNVRFSFCTEITFPLTHFSFRAQECFCFNRAVSWHVTKL